MTRVSLPEVSKKLPRVPSPASRVAGGNFLGAEMIDQKSTGRPGHLPEVFVPATWRGVTARRGADFLGVSFDLHGAGIARLALPTESGRKLMESLRGYLDCPKGFDITPYGGYDYDRIGCSVTIDVAEACYAAVVRAPNGAVVQSWGAREPEELARQLIAWCEKRDLRVRRPIQNRG